MQLRAVTSFVDRRRTIKNARQRTHALIHWSMGDLRKERDTLKPVFAKLSHELKVKINNFIKNCYEGAA